MPLSGKEMRKLFERVGYVLVAGGGKGSHWKLRARTEIIYPFLLTHHLHLLCCKFLQTNKFPCEFAPRI
ncbi:MAG: hypothetical protein KR126chlam2_01220 [Chlamydiae bacterium]|nr:hypothetical protein [Chlamydiota bacterium]